MLQTQLAYVSDTWNEPEANPKKAVGLRHTDSKLPWTTQNSLWASPIPLQITLSRNGAKPKPKKVQKLPGAEALDVSMSLELIHQSPACLIPKREGNSMSSLKLPTPSKAILLICTMLYVNPTSKKKKKVNNDGTKRKEQSSNSRYKTHRNRDRSPKTPKNIHIK